jgi:Ca-activated chloride channel family protein
MVSFSFVYPQFLWFLMLVPFFVLVYFSSLSSNKRRGIVFGNFKALERFYGIEFFSKNFFNLNFNLLILILLIFALAGMGVNFNANTMDASFVLAIDTSSSMLTEDISPSRFDSAKVAAKDFIVDIPVGTNVGVIGFSGATVVYQDITTNKLLSTMGINNIEIGEVSGTNVYDALLSSDKMFDSLGDGKKRVVILISDGQSNVGDAPLLIEYAERNNIIIYSICVGTEAGGESVYNVISKADVDFLKSLSFNTGGEFYMISDGDFSEFLNDFNANGIYNIDMDLSIYLIIFDILLFFINWVLYNFRFKVYP